MSPEVLAFALEKYLDSLRHQVEVAKSFFFQEIGEGFEGLLELPDEVRFRIEQLMWEARGEEGIDLRDPLIPAAILHSLEERMGFHE